MSSAPKRGATSAREEQAAISARKITAREQRAATPLIRKAGRDWRWIWGIAIVCATVLMIAHMFKNSIATSFVNAARPDWAAFTHAAVERGTDPVVAACSTHIARQVVNSTADPFGCGIIFAMHARANEAGLGASIAADKPLRRPR